ncbi:bifunctional adenosylcobinamide kinase/adenosylcobinamide-phosphate guanylyltransferase [Planococcus lenghuensis]|uniref:Adenosylcobinamide kinase n=1 Tax=Planococcus lenghuensis TaxID=2213202 RepID=A0A1Q2L1R6_9BACL|nr:bifunctional adenosylcobinamide kinase/adenosylcobinamide-phosphate guanylyltransferase [Planococcus lenghuensis]AQQ54314.1 cobinamide kinase [Planococcus lenghuensis]
MAAGKLIFVCGGVRSGKSNYAEKRILEVDSARRIYIASGKASDAEMEARIQRHRNEREGLGWLTIEQPTDLAQTISHLKKGDAVLWDCLTTYLANELYDGWETGAECATIPGCMDRKWRLLQEAIRNIREIAGLVVIVSNEVLDEPVQSEIYQRWLGMMHRWLAAEADEAIEIEFGMAQKRK